MTMFACPTTLFARPSHPVCSCICIQLQGSRCSPHRCVRAAIQPGSWAVAVADARQAEPCRNVALSLCRSVALSLCRSVALLLCCSVALSHACPSCPPESARGLNASGATGREVERAERE